MLSKNIQIKILSLTGMVLTVFPVVFMLGTSLFHLSSTGTFMMDYLLPAELALVSFIGIILVIGASLLAKMFRKSVFTLASAIAILLGGSLLYVTLSGLGVAEGEPSGLVIGLAITIMGVYSLILVAIGLLGLWIALKAFKK